MNRRSLRSQSALVVKGRGLGSIGPIGLRSQGLAFQRRGLEAIRLLRMLSCEPGKASNQ